MALFSEVYYSQGKIPIAQTFQCFTTTLFPKRFPNSKGHHIGDVIGEIYHGSGAQGSKDSESRPERRGGLLQGFLVFIRNRTYEPVAFYCSAQRGHFKSYTFTS